MESLLLCLLPWETKKACATHCHRSDDILERGWWIKPAFLLRSPWNGSLSLKRFRKKSWGPLWSTEFAICMRALAAWIDKLCPDSLKLDGFICSLSNNVLGSAFVCTFGSCDDGHENVHLDCPLLQMMAGRPILDKPAKWSSFATNLRKNTTWNSYMKHFPQKVIYTISDTVILTLKVLLELLRTSKML
jgi:hypothetical protein